MKHPNQYRYPIDKRRMQPVGIIVFTSVMSTLGLKILFQHTRPNLNPVKEKWMIGIMVSVTITKFVLMAYCRMFKNKIVRAYTQDHFCDVVTNSVGLAAVVLVVRFYWWINPTGAIIISIYTMGTWARTVLENVWSLFGRTTKAGKGSATLFMAYAGAVFAYACLKGLNGVPDVVECAFVQSTIIELPLFASKVRLGKNVMKEVLGLGHINDFQKQSLENLKSQISSMNLNHQLRKGSSLQVPVN